MADLLTALPSYDSDDFLLIGITPPHIFDGEADRITSLLESGIRLIHLRHPAASLPEMRALLEAIPSHLHPRLTLHDSFELCEAYAIGGVHLNSRNPSLPDTLKPLADRLRVSRSCHSLHELADCGAMDYATLSPIFDSISKDRYRSGFPPSSYPQLAQHINECGVRVVALGGVTAERLPLLHQLNFSGAAMLGALFKPV